MRRLFFAVMGFCVGLAIDVLPTIVANHLGLPQGCAEGCPNIRKIAVLLYLLIPCALCVAFCIAAWDRTRPVRTIVLVRSTVVAALLLLAFLALTGNAGS